MADNETNRSEELMRQGLRIFIVAALIVAPFSAFAAAICKTDAHECRTASAHAEGAVGGAYNLDNVGPAVVLSAHFENLGDTPWTIDHVVVRVDRDEPFSVKTEAAASSYYCLRECGFDAQIFARFTKAQWDQMTSGRKVLLAASDHGTISDPIYLDSAVLRAALVDMIAEGFTL